MASIAAVCNLALSAIGNSVEINDLEKENTAEANACRRFYEQVRDEVLRDFPWPFAQRTVALALVTTNPTTEWAYAYRYPVDCLMFGRILGLVRNESRKDRVPYEMASDGAGGQLIYTDWPNAVGQYIIRATDPTNWQPDFVQAVALLLASYIAPRITKGDPYKLGQLAFQKYQWAIQRAFDNALNEGQPEVLPESEFILGRDS